MLHKIFYILNKHKLYIIIAINVILFAVLLYKDIFSDRTLIPNFEPYPDTIHYVNPSRSFIQNGVLKVFRKGYFRNPSVPPLYSIILIPVYFLFNDVRMFYVTNTILSFLSLFFFYLIIKQITKNIYSIGFCLFLYVTNYFIYWYPNLAMSENLFLFLFMSSIYVLIISVSPLTAVLAGVIGISFYGTKYACAPLMVSYIFLYFFKIITSKKIHFKIVYCLIPIISLLLFAVIFLNVGVILKSIGSSITMAIILPLKSLFMSKEVTTANFHNEAFSKYYFDRYFPQYIKAILGSPSRFLWDNTPIVPRLVGIFGLTGLVASLFMKRFRFLSFSLIIMLFSAIFFIASFYSFDMRYVYHAIPVVILGLVLFITILESIFKKLKATKLFYIGLIVFFIFYFLINAIRLKKQIMLNIKYKETPWYYVAVLELNKYFKKSIPLAKEKKPILISALIPFYIDFFSNGNYEILPLSPYQDFFKKDKFAWGNNDYSNLISLYKSYINKGYDVYIHNSGLGNVDYLHRSFNKIENTFILTKVAEGCFDNCNIYKLTLRN